MSKPKTEKAKFATRPLEAITDAKCTRCLFARCIQEGYELENGELATHNIFCECHVARPTRFGFPRVRTDDFCALHVDAYTHERTFGGLAPTQVTL